MEWLFNPTIWVGVLTLVILGADNPIFIAIMAAKLSTHRWDKKAPPKAVTKSSRSTSHLSQVTDRSSPAFVFEVLMKERLR